MRSKEKYFARNRCFDEAEKLRLKADRLEKREL
jgi:hypothetical protein